MSGSRKWMIYTRDDGSECAVQIDESNGEVAGFADATTSSTNTLAPKGLQMRYANMREPVSGATRKIPIGSPADSLWTGSLIGALLSLDISGVASLVLFTVSSLVGEKMRRAVPYDTGLIDGDAT